MQLRRQTDYLAFTVAQQVFGNTSGLTSSEIRLCNKLFTRRIEKEEIVSLDIAREVFSLAEKLSRRIGLLISREGRIEHVILGKKDILYLPDLGRFRFGKGRLRRLRLIYTDLTRDPSKAQIPQDIYTDLEKLRLDMVVGIKIVGNRTMVSYSHLASKERCGSASTITEELKDFPVKAPDFADLMENLESELELDLSRESHTGKIKALLVSVSDRSESEVRNSLEELRELARTAGVTIAGEIVQRKKPDPRTLLGSGKLEEVVLTCLRLGADLIIFDTELHPSQWRSVTKATDLKVIDRSMLILDIFAQRASSADGRLQVELAQLKYNLPRLTEMDSGLSRLSGGIGGRGPGETKLEMSRRVVRDRIAMYEKKIESLKGQRDLKKQKRRESTIPLIAIVGYTNVGKSTLFNHLTRSDVIAENKLFATLDPAKRRFVLPNLYLENGRPQEVILSDTVGFIRDLPAELLNAFRATLEEIGDADLLIHVLDASDPLLEERKLAVEKILTTMNFSSIPTLVVLNKIDALAEGSDPQLLCPGVVYPISAKHNQGVNALVSALVQMLQVTKSTDVQNDTRDIFSADPTDAEDEQELTDLFE
jgi:GTP-binding protein HflX